MQIHLETCPSPTGAYSQSTGVGSGGRWVRGRGFSRAQSHVAGRITESRKKWRRFRYHRSTDNETGRDLFSFHQKSIWISWQVLAFRDRGLIRHPCVCALAFRWRLGANHNRGIDRLCCKIAFTTKASAFFSSALQCTV